MKIINTQNGFSLIEMVIAMGLFALLVTTAVVAINPSKQFAEARDAQRSSHLHILASAITRATYNGPLGTNCTAGVLPVNTTKVIGTGVGEYDLGDCIVPAYIQKIPVDPVSGVYTSDVDYASGYRITKDTNGYYVIEAPHAEGDIEPVTI